MTKIKKIFLWTLFCLVANYSNAVDDEEMQYVNDGIVQFDCDAQTSSFYFNALYRKICRTSHTNTT